MTYTHKTFDVNGETRSISYQPTANKKVPCIITLNGAGGQGRGALDRHKHLFGQVDALWVGPDSTGDRELRDDLPAPPGTLATWDGGHTKTPLRDVDFIGVVMDWAIGLGCTSFYVIGHSAGAAFAYHLSIHLGHLIDGFALNAGVPNIATLNQRGGSRAYGGIVVCHWSLDDDNDIITGPFSPGLRGTQERLRMRTGAPSVPTAQEPITGTTGIAMARTYERLSVILGQGYGHCMPGPDVCGGWDFTAWTLALWGVPILGTTAKATKKPTRSRAKKS